MVCTDNNLLLLNNVATGVASALEGITCECLWRDEKSPESGRASCSRGRRDE